MSAAPESAPPSIWHRLDAWLARLRPHRRALALAIDALTVWASWNATYLFRLGFDDWVGARPGYDGWVIAAIVVVYAAAFVALRVPQGLWRFSGFGEVQRLAAACAVAGVVAGAGVRAFGLVGVPRAVLALHPVVTLMGVVLVRMAYRMLYEHARSRITGSERDVRRAIVLGAGGAARRLLAGIHQQGWVVLGLLDDDPLKLGGRVAGVPVLGTLDAVRDAALRACATHVIVAIPTATLAQRQRALALAAESGLPVLTVPAEDELRSGRSRLERLREIEPDDLLGRAPVQLDEAGVGALVRGATVLVTGAGGSIGSELCRQLATLAPARLLLLELSEFNLYTLDAELAARWPAVERRALVGDVKDLAHMRALMQRWRPALVFHAAAYKHVPLMEGPNALAALRNNTLGTWHAARAAAEAGVGCFVLVSTDKAVNPTNVMGASKRAAEMAISALAPQHPGTRFVAVRFGNVLGSSGSVIPRFKEQIARGGPVTVTHPDIIRYFMTIPEAARLVLQAAAVGQTGQVLVLDMGEPVKIVDLARQLIRLAGHTPDEIRIEYTGLRAGEKLYEELLADADQTLPTAVARLHVARLQGGAPAREAALHALLALAAGADEAHAAHDLRGADGAPDAPDQAVRAALHAAVPEYRRADAAAG